MKNLKRRKNVSHALARAGSEFALIDAFLQPFGLARDGANFGRRSGVLAGPGDDCAQLIPSRGARLVATTDAALDGVHFQLGRATPEDAGWKALAMNLSDLAAAGARPRWFLCSVGIPNIGTATTLRAVLGGLAKGMAPLAKESGCALVGGNLTRAQQWSMTITALGEAKHPLSRAGGKPGDLLFLIGELGAAALGLSLLQARPARGRQMLVDQQPISRRAARGLPERFGVRSGDSALLRSRLAAIQAQLRPRPQLAAGKIAATIASAAIDISDGLVQDLGHLCARSGCGARIDCAALPRSIAVQEAEARLAKQGSHPYSLSLAGGEEYALLVAVPPARAKSLQARLRAARLPAKQIGELTDRSGKKSREAIELFAGGAAIPLPARPGHDHFA